MQLPLPSVIMPPTTETEIKELRDLVIGLREEIRVGFAKVDTKFAEVNGESKRIEAKTDTKLAEIQGQINVLEERTRLGFWGFIGRAVIIGIFVLAAGFAVKYFLFGTVKL
jgi:uncharacterized membrane protein